MILKIELGGTQTDTHCSMTSSINACGKLNFDTNRCTLFRKKLEYDYDNHAYKRCEACKDAELVEIDNEVIEDKCSCTEKDCESCKQEFSSNL